MTILNLGKLIDFNDIEIDKFIDVFESLPEVVHHYGSPFNIPKYPVVMTYVDSDPRYGTISFSRHTSSHPVFKELCEYSLDKLNTVFNVDLKLSLEKVHIIRTMGDIRVHRDEAGRKTCINIGLRNASGATTYTSSVNNPEQFYNDYQEVQLQDEFGYLLDTFSYHTVKSTNNMPRYMITYGFGEEFNTLKELLVCKY